MRGEGVDGTEDCVVWEGVAGWGFGVAEGGLLEPMDSVVFEC